MNSQLFAIFMALVLASCGGGSGGSSEKPTSSFSSKVSSSINSVSSGASSDASSSSSSSGETINGHIVPPEPDPVLNDSTLAGIDVNANGVRDDVERVIAASYEDREEFDAAILGASALQKMMTDSHDYKKNSKDFHCETRFLGDDQQNIITFLTHNTKERRSRFNEVSNLKPTSEEMEFDQNGNPLDSCSNWVRGN